jgi:hypothetical protein
MIAHSQTAKDPSMRIENMEASPGQGFSSDEV